MGEWPALHGRGHLERQPPNLCASPEVCQHSWGCFLPAVLEGIRRVCSETQPWRCLVGRAGGSFHRVAWIVLAVRRHGVGKASAPRGESRKVCHSAGAATAATTFASDLAAQRAALALLGHQTVPGTLGMASAPREQSAAGAADLLRSLISRAAVKCSCEVPSSCTAGPPSKGPVATGWNWPGPSSKCACLLWRCATEASAILPSSLPARHVDDGVRKRVSTACRRTSACAQLCSLAGAGCCHPSGLSSALSCRQRHF